MKSRDDRMPVPSVPDDYNPDMVEVGRYTDVRRVLSNLENFHQDHDNRFRYSLDINSLKRKGFYQN